MYELLPEFNARRLFPLAPILLPSPGPRYIGPLEFIARGYFFVVDLFHEHR
jgi:hypothetical protein